MRALLELRLVHRVARAPHAERVTMPSPDSSRRSASWLAPSSSSTLIGTASSGITALQRKSASRSDSLAAMRSSAPSPIVPSSATPTWWSTSLQVASIATQSPTGSPPRSGRASRVGRAPSSTRPTNTPTRLAPSGASSAGETSQSPSRLHPSVSSAGVTSISWLSWPSSSSSTDSCPVHPVSVHPVRASIIAIVFVVFVMSRSNSRGPLRSYRARTLHSATAGQLRPRDRRIPGSQPPIAPERPVTPFRLWTPWRPEWPPELKGGYF